MEVKISFDTGKDTLEDFKKLEDYIQKIIKEKGGQPNLMPAQQSAALPPQQQTSVPQPNPPEPRPPQKTSGGCRVMEYRDMSKEMSDIFSGKTKRRSF
ncbi:MAG: hypothetical protein ABIB71_00355 [Candidatus Woesearchaeota archaeon]